MSFLSNSHPIPNSPTNNRSSSCSDEVLYFAYGSNMYLPQMAVRCRGSVVYGCGLLRGYKWQNNSLGGGNVISASPADFVEGVLFSVTREDVETLRRYEGTAWEYFQEKEIDVEVEPIAATAQGGKSLKPADVAEFLTRYNAEFNLKLTEPKAAEKLVNGEQNGDGHSVNGTTNGHSKTVRKALVYMSGPKYATPGPIRDEYIVRMHLAMAYARLLGCSKEYFEKSMYPTIFGKFIDDR